MREHLLGYLMGALDEVESAGVQLALQSDPQLAAECARLEQTLAPLSEDECWIDPPPRLAERTAALIGAHAEGQNRRRDTASAGLSRHEAAGTVSLSPAAEMVSRPVRWTLADAVVAAGICAAAAMLFFPAIANSRQQAAIIQCQNNLRQIGTALVGYSRNHQGQFPLVPASGKLAVAGIYAPLLKEAGLVESDGVFLCPAARRGEGETEFLVPGTEEILQSEGKQLALVQRRLGGSYGYAFGYNDDGGAYRANVNRSRPRFALAADAPSLHLKNLVSANHGGSGQNVLFEDGHVEYLKECRPAESGDNVFLSDRGYVEAGRHFNDAVIAHSASSPVLRRPAASD